MQNIKIETKKKKQIVDITDRVNELLSIFEKESGTLFLFVTHTTCSLSTADLDPGTDEDYLIALDDLIPDLNYNHPHNPGHVDDHINSTLIGPSVMVPFKNNKLELGTWQRVVLIELNGPRKRNIVVRLF